jgi:ABC-type amino acid transport system permease subunit
MSFREKHLWISIVASVGVWGWYFWFLTRHLLDGKLVNDHFTGDVSVAFMGALVLVALIEVVLTLIATFTTPKHEQKTRDEREILAALKASHVALMALIALVFCVSMAAYFAGLIGDNMVGGSAVFAVDGNLMVLGANLLLASIVIAELIRAGVTLTLLRALR